MTPWSGSYRNTTEVPRTRTTRYGLLSSSYRAAATIWNSLPNEARDISNFNQLKNFINLWDDTDCRCNACKGQITEPNCCSCETASLSPISCHVCYALLCHVCYDLLCYVCYAFFCCCLNYLLSLQFSKSLLLAVFNVPIKCVYNCHEFSL